MNIKERKDQIMVEVNNNTSAIQECIDQLVDLAITYWFTRISEKKYRLAKQKLDQRVVVLKKIADDNHAEYKTLELLDELNIPIS
jgi:hypothetical protein